MKNRGLHNTGFLTLIGALVLSTFLFVSPMKVSAIEAQSSDGTIANPGVQAAATGRTVVRWFVGLGNNGSDPDQISIQQEAVNDFNASQNDILLVVEFVPHNVAREALAAEIAQGNAPDIVGPAGWAAAEPFHGQWLDLDPLITSSGFDTSIFTPSLFDMYHTDEGQVGLPFTTFPAAIYYNPTVFDNAGVNYPPAHYGDLYTMPDDITMVEWNWDTVAQVSKLLTLDINGHNALSPDFDKTQIDQYGFSFQWQNGPSYWGEYWQSGQFYQGTASSYVAHAPNSWKESWNWVYDGMWSDQPFIPNGPASATLWDGNVFNSGKVAMIESPSWYTCCIGDFVGGGGTFQFGAMPKYNGQVAGRVDADTFRILKNSTHPNEAFQALSYLVTTGVDKLVIGSDVQPTPYAGISAIATRQQESLTRSKADYPFVTQESWDVLLAGLNYPDIPNAEGWMPNYLDSWAYLQSFTDKLMNTDALDLTTEISALESDLTTLFNQDPAPLTTRTVVRWFVGLGTGSDSGQIPMQREVADDFNASQSDILLVMEIIPNGNAREALAAEIGQGVGPDIVGPVGWAGSNAFYGKWLDLAPLITSSGFDTSIFNPALANMYQTEEGQVGLPFAVFPGGMFYQPAMFDQAGLNYPPQVYGEKYVMPDNTERDWNWETVTQIAKLLTLDVNGKNSTQIGFNRAQIVQVGYSPQWQSALSIGTFYGGAAKTYSGTETGSYAAALTNGWKEGFKWYYNGMWGTQPFIATGPLSGSPEFGTGNVFNSGKAAMGLTQVWYTCCLGDFANAGFEFQVGIQPMGSDGIVHGRIDADTFRILQGTQQSAEAFDVLTYLITTGGDKLLPVYGAMPAIASKTDAFFEQKSAEYPFVTPESWNVFVQGLAYPDAPSAESWMPNFDAATNHFSAFQDKLNNTPGLDMNKELKDLETELTLIFNYGYVPSIPILLSPAPDNHLLNNRPTFDWMDMPQATAYNFQISKNAAFTVLLQNTTIIPSTYTAVADLPASTTLYWRVRTKWSGGYSPWSDVRMLVTANPPSLPVLVSPATNFLTTNYTPTFNWNNSTLPVVGGTTFDHYQIQMDDDSDFSSTVIDDVTITSDITDSAYLPSLPLDSNEKFYWRVRAFNTGGEYSSWSSVWVLRTALTPPVLSAPAQDEAISTLRPTFNWEDVSGAAGYAIQISTSSTFAVISNTANMVSSTYTPATNLPQGKLYWRVHATGTNGPSAWSIRSYQGPYPPAVPTLISPANNALVTTPTMLFKWSALTVPPGAPAFDKYQIQIATDAGFTSLVLEQDFAGIANNQFTLPAITFNPNTKYYWHVRGANTFPQTGNWSATWSFRMRMDAPLLLTPITDSDALSPRPTFDWQDVPGPGIVTGYTIQFSRNMGFTLIVHSGNPGTSTYVPSVDLPKDIDLYWRVQGKGVNGPSGWSETRFFHSANAPSTPVLSAPALNALLADDTPLLKWGPVTMPAMALFQYYQVQVADNLDFTSPVVDNTSITNKLITQFQIITPLIHNTKYYWRVRALNTDNEGSNWSAVWTFRMKADAPSLLAPINGTTVGSLTPIFSWSDASTTGNGTVTNYTIQISASPTFGTLIVNSSTGNLTYQRLTLFPTGKTFYWRVRVNGANGPSAWSTVFSFMTP